MPIVNSAATGITKLVYAIMTDEVLETYGPVKEAPPLINIKVTPKSDTATLYANNVAVETATSLGNIPVEFETQDMPLEVQADFLGHTLDAALGTLTYNTNDQAPYLALGYERTKANGKSRFVWLYKVKFEEIGEEGKTQEEKITFQTPKVAGLGIANKNGDWKKVADEDTKGTPILDFLATVPGTGPFDAVAPTVTSVPIDAAVGVLAASELVLTFDKAIQPSTMTPANVFVMAADGTAVAATLAISALNTVVTVHPAIALTVGTYILVATTNIKSASGIALATNYVVNFTV
jgi:phi13 family phage major tail protein